METTNTPTFTITDDRISPTADEVTEQELRDQLAEMAADDPDPERGLVGLAETVTSNEDGLYVVLDGERVRVAVPTLPTAGQAATIDRLERLMRADGFADRLTTRPLIDELREFAPAGSYDWAGDPLGAGAGAIIVFRDSDEQHDVTGEHIIPDEGMILDRDGHEVAR